MHQKLGLEARRDGSSRRQGSLATPPGRGSRFDALPRSGTRQEGGQPLAEGPIGEPIATRLRVRVSRTVEQLVQLINTAPIEPVEHDSGALVRVAPPHSFGEISPELRALQMSVKRQYDSCAEIIRVFLNRAPKDLANQWKEEDRDLRVWLELDSNWALQPHRTSNEKQLRAAAQAIADIIDVFAALGPGGVLVIPDTNSLIDQPDPTTYRPVAGRQEFTFLLLPTVLGELDDLKIGHKNPEVRDGAKRAISRIKGWRNQARQKGGTLVDGATVDGTITVKAHNIEPDMESSLSWLDESVPDDRIVAAVLAVEAENPSATALLITGDINLQNKADAALIETVETP